MARHGGGRQVPYARDVRPSPTRRWSIARRLWSNRLVRRITVALSLVCVGLGHSAAAQQPAPSTRPACIHNPKALRSGLLVKPHAVRRVKPDFHGIPPITGTVFIEMDLDETGKVTQTCIVKGLRDDVDDAALRAIRQWRFTPGKSRSRTAVPVIQAIAVPVDIK